MCCTLCEQRKTATCQTSNANIHIRLLLMSKCNKCTSFLFITADATVPAAEIFASSRILKTAYARRSSDVSIESCRLFEFPKINYLQWIECNSYEYKTQHTLTAQCAMRKFLHLTHSSWHSPTISFSQPHRWHIQNKRRYRKSDYRRLLCCCEHLCRETHKLR